MFAGIALVIEGKGQPPSIKLHDADHSHDITRFEQSKLTLLHVYVSSNGKDDEADLYVHDFAPQFQAIRLQSPPTEKRPRLPWKSRPDVPIESLASRIDLIDVGPGSMPMIACL